MKKLISLFIAMCICLGVIPAFAAPIQICYDGGTHIYTGNVYRLLVNGNEVHSDMEPIIFNGHALVPVREVFESCGATVDYIGDSQCVKVRYNSTLITMHINNNRAYINGQAVRIPDGVVPKLIYKPGGLTKTMVPARFISETVGMNVEFDGEKGEILIDEKISEPQPTPTPKPTPTPTPTKKPGAQNITSIDTEFYSDNKLSLNIECDGAVSGLVSNFDLSSPERVVIDFKGVKYKNKTETIETGSNVIKAVRVGVDDERTRIVIDVEDLVSYVVSPKGNTVNAVITVSGDIKSTPTPTASPKPTSTAKPTATPKPTAKPDYDKIGNSAADSKYNTGIVKASSEDAKKIIMLDAGHGGSDPGALGTLNGKTINEKDLTLSITYKVKAILESNGYKTAMTRTGDTLPSLSERPEMANKKDCALFVSIHINSATATEAKGTEVYYSEENNGDEYGVTSQLFATKVLNGMLKYMKSTDRGVRMANWAVIRRSNMPAVLVEVGFISNESELKNMCSDDYQNKTAMGIAEGIINTIHYVKVP